MNIIISQEAKNYVRSMGRKKMTIYAKIWVNVRIITKRLGILVHSRIPRRFYIMIK